MVEDFDDRDGLDLGERPFGLRQHFEAAFGRSDVSIDFAGFTGETLHGALTEPLDKVRAGLLTPQTISIRILLPDLSAAMALPARTDGRTDGGAVRDRARRISVRATESIGEALRELADLGLVTSATTTVRTYATTPLFKLYVLNNNDVFMGYYPIVKHNVTANGQVAEIYDAMGKDTTLFHLTDRDGAAANPYVGQARAWFESVWTTIARDQRP